MITGDFNLPKVKWVENDEIAEDYIPIVGESDDMPAIIARYVTDSMIQLGLTQMNNICNEAENVLELIYSNVPELTITDKAIVRLIPEELSDKISHSPISILIECDPTIIPIDDKPFAAYCFRKANFPAIREYIDTYDFGHIFNIADIDTMLEEFYELIYNIYERFVPKATIKP